MKVNRAQELLTAGSNAQGYSASSDENGQLVSNSLMQPYPSSERDQLSARVASLPQTATRVREIRRTLDTARGPKIPLAAGTLPIEHNALRAELFQQMQAMAELSRESTLLNGLVPDGSGGYLRLTGAGRRALTKLSVWSTRYSAAELSEFLAAMAFTDAQLEARLERARLLAESLIARESWVGGANTALMTGDQDPDLVIDQGTRTQARGVALVLAKSENMPNQTYQDFLTVAQTVAELGVPIGEMDLIAALLQTGPLGGTAGVTRFREVRDLLVQASGRSDGVALAAAVLSDLPEASNAWIGPRFQQVMSAVPGLGMAEIGILTRSPYQVNVLQQRYQAASDAIKRIGYGTDPGAVTASVLLAVSPHPVDRFVPRFAFLDDHIREVISSPAAAGILAATPLAPEEAWDFFQTAVGAVTRSGCFDVTAEIDYLALILSLDPGPYLSTALPSGTFVPGVDFPATAAVPTTSVIAYHTVVYPRFMVWTAAHPVHFHSIPAFG